MLEFSSSCCASRAGMGGSSENRRMLFNSSDGCFRVGVGIGTDLATLDRGLALPLVDTDPDTNPDTETVGSMSPILITLLSQLPWHREFPRRTHFTFRLRKK
jgi:hypothetical protein